MFNCNINPNLQTQSYQRISERCIFADYIIKFEKFFGFTELGLKKLKELEDQGVLSNKIS